MYTHYAKIVGMSETDPARTARPYCGTCGTSYEVAIPVGANVLEVLNDAADAHMAGHKAGVIHIRKQIARKRGDGFYAPKYGKSEDGSQTLCGAEPTGWDESYGDTRHARNLANVTCEQCKELR